MKPALRVHIGLLSFYVSLFTARATPNTQRISDLSEMPPGPVLATRAGSQFALLQPLVDQSPQYPELSSGFFEVDLCWEEPGSSN